jgi:hypothetical protein
MLKIALGVIVGFIVWSVVWIGGVQTLATLLPDSYGAQFAATQAAFAENRTPEMLGAQHALMNLGISILASFLAGYMGSLLAGEYRRTTMILGILLVLTGLLVEIAYWAIAPPWYHILFILMLYPITVLGGRLRRSV